MQRSGTGLTRVFVRALVVPVLALVAVTGYLVGAAAIAANEAPHVSSSPTPRVETPWKASYSRQFPGCVAAVLWPERETPVAVVVRWRSGEVDRISRGEAAHRALTRTRIDDGTIIGACYRR
jgi:hypothetical protein